MNKLDRLLDVVRFECLARVNAAHLEGDLVVGTFSGGRYDDGDLLVELKPYLMELNPFRLAMQFANWGKSPTDILNFTKRYGVLRVEPPRPLTLHDRGQPFRFPLEWWRDCQKWHRERWTILPKITQDPRQFHGSGFFWLSPSGNSYCFESLEGLIDYAVTVVPRELLKICPAKDKHGKECKQKYFVASNSRQKYCGNQECLDWGVRQNKKKWWHENKPGISPPETDAASSR